MTQEALKLALEALETPWNAPYVDGCDLALGKRVKAITAIKEALAQTQEPVACAECERLKDALKRANCLAEHFERAWYLRGDEIEELQAPPPQRTWVDLTDEEVRDLWSWSATSEAEKTANTQQHALAQVIEAKLKELNT